MRRGVLAQHRLLVTDPLLPAHLVKPGKPLHLWGREKEGDTERHHERTNASLDSHSRTAREKPNPHTVRNLGVAAANTSRASAHPCKGDCTRPRPTPPGDREGPHLPSRHAGAAARSPTGFPAGNSRENSFLPSASQERNCN